MIETLAIRPTVAAALAVAAFGAVARGDGPIAIAEIHYRSAADRAEDEFIEIRNTSAEAVDLGGWRFSDGIGFRFPEGTVLAAGASVAIAKDADHLTAARGLTEGILGDYEGRLADEGERITLLDADGHRADTVRYDDDPPWPQGADGRGPSLECVDPLRDNDDPRNWLPSRTDGGTPGRPNSVASTNLPPFVAAVGLSPRLPGPRDDVLVQAVVEDEEGIASVSLWYDRGDGARRLVPRDDGRAPDRFGGDGTYSATIPPAPAGTIVDYALEAEDARGARSAARRGVYPVIDPAVTSRLPIYRIFVRPEDWARLERNIWSDTYVPAVFVCGDAIFPDAGLRFRGGRPRRFRKKSLKLRFDEERPFRGAVRLNLNAAAMDDDYMTEPLAYGFYEACGVPASRTRFARVQRNGAFWGLFIDVEQVDERYLERRGFDPDGALYKAVGIASSLRPLEGTGYDYRVQYEKKIRLEEGHGDLIGFIHDLEDPPGGAEAYLRAHLDVEGFCDYLAATNLMCVWDGIQHNFYLYRDTAGDGRWHVFPWDLDHAWGEWEWHYYWDDTYPLLMGTEAYPFAGVWYAWNRLWTVFLDTPAFRRMYFERIRERLNTTFTEWEIGGRIEAYRAEIAEEVRLDEARWPDDLEPQHVGPRRTMEEEIPLLEEAIRERRRYLASLLGVRLTHRPPGAVFIRADADGSGTLDIADPVAILMALFAGGALPCLDAGDANDDGILDIADAIGLLGYLFVQGAPPPAPFPGCGGDGTDDGLGCDAYEGC